MKVDEKDQQNLKRWKAYGGVVTIGFCLLHSVMCLQRGKPTRTILFPGTEAYKPYIHGISVRIPVPLHCPCILW